MEDEQFAGMALESVISEPPTDVEHPVMYERAVYILGAVGILAILAAAVLAVFGKTVDAGILTIGASAVSGLVGLLVPRQG